MSVVMSVLRSGGFEIANEGVGNGDGGMNALRDRQNDFSDVSSHAISERAEIQLEAMNMRITKDNLTITCFCQDF